MFKPWLTGNIRDIARSTKRDYPPKRKKPWMSGNFAEMEHFHEGTYRPFPHPVLPPKVKRDGCAGRVLRPLSQVEWSSGEGGLPKDGDVKEFQAKVSGSVGKVTYSMDPFWSEINEEGDVATIDPNTGLITLEEGVCQGPYPPWIIYQVCDDCGCSSGTIWLEDSSEDCDSCAEADCDLPSITGSLSVPGGAGGNFSILTNDTKQFTLTNAQGSVSWAVSGTGTVSIDQTGLVTTGSDACGTLTVTATDSCCGDFTQGVRVVDSGQWVFLSDINYGSTVVIAGGCNAITGGNCTVVDAVETKSFWTNRCCCGPTCAAELPGLPSCATPTVTCAPGLCVDGCAVLNYITRQIIRTWECL